MLLSREGLQKALPQTRQVEIDLYYTPILNTLVEFQINTPKRIAMFLAQIAHESGNLRYVKENLNYSADGLELVFGKYFPTRALAEQYARKPELIASRAYADRMGNGPEKSGDGWKFRGRGLIQLTGMNNYTACGKALKVDLIKTPEYLETPVGAARSSGWFWKTNNLNTFADTGDITGSTRRINGGYAGINDRTAKYEVALRALQR
jgi:putative chitinase